MAGAAHACGGARQRRGRPRRDSQHRERPCRERAWIAAGRARPRLAPRPHLHPCGAFDRSLGPPRQQAPVALDRGQDAEALGEPDPQRGAAGAYEHKHVCCHHQHRAQSYHDRLAPRRPGSHRGHCRHRRRRGRGQSRSCWCAPTAVLVAARPAASAASLEPTPEPPPPTPDLPPPAAWRAAPAFTRHRQPRMHRRRTAQPDPSRHPPAAEAPRTAQTSQPGQPGPPGQPGQPGRPGQPGQPGQPA